MLDKVVIITGGASGQGLAEAKLLASEGASVVITDLSDSGAAVAQELGERALFVKQDVSSADDWARVTEQTLAKFGRIDALVNNAGAFKPANLFETTQELWDLHYKVNLLGPFLGIKAIAGIMKDAGNGGSIINVSSLAGMVGWSGIFAYATSKWAVRGMSKQASVELGEFGIRVNSVYPGSIDTPMLDGNPAARSEAMLNSIPLRRLGVPLDVANLIKFLVSDKSSYISGAEITITGGM